MQTRLIETGTNKASSVMAAAAAAITFVASSSSSYFLFARSFECSFDVIHTFLTRA
jgi:hypothetical protein